MKRVVRVLLGFAVACLVAAYTKLLFAVTPIELAGLPSEVAIDRIAWLGDLGWKIAVLFALFSLPFALVGLSLAELRAKRNWTYYAAVALGVALVGFLAQWAGELPSAPTVMTSYAFSAYATAGVAAGLSYWLIAGRHAGRPTTSAYPLIIDVTTPAPSATAKTSTTSSATEASSSRPASPKSAEPKSSLEAALAAVAAKSKSESSRQQLSESRTEGSARNEPDSASTTPEPNSAKNEEKPGLVVPSVPRVGPTTSIDRSSTPPARSSASVPPTGPKKP